MRGERVQGHGSAYDRIALVIFGAYVAIALPLILVVLGKDRWFFGDEWSFLAERDAGNVGDLFRAHAEHWSTIPVVVYRVLFNVFALRSYVPYETAVVLAHLATAVLLLVVMRRAGVRPWTATIVASVFVLFGPGEENIVWAFQIGFVGAILFGLIHLVSSDHDGPIDRRDWLGLLAGSASLMCSGVSLVMIAIVGLAALLRRGWRAAAFHTVPLGIIYATWYLVTKPGGIDNPYGRGANPRELARFVWSGLRGTFQAIAGVRPLALVLPVIVVAGAVLIVRRRDDQERRRLAAPFALALGALLFLVGTGVTRWFVTPTADSQSRYLYTLAALVLPAIAVCADAIIGRWPLTAPIVLGLFLVGTIANVGKFGDEPPFTAGYQRGQRELITALAYSDEANSVPAYVRPNVWFTIGWLRGVAADRGIPRPDVPFSPSLESQIHALLDVAQLDVSAPTTSCETVRGTATIRPHAGQRAEFRFANKPAVGANFFMQDAILVTVIQKPPPPPSTIAFKSDYGHILEIQRGGLVLEIRATDPRQHLVLCGVDGVVSGR